MEGNNCGEVNTCRTLKGDMGYFNGICFCRFKLVPATGIRIFLFYFLLVQEEEETVHRGIEALPLGRKREAESFPCTCCFLIAFSSNNLHAQVAGFKVAYLDPPQLSKWQ